MTAGYRVVCSDGEIRHESLFQTRQDAETWMTWHTGYHACWRHTIRREAEWEVAAFRIRPRRPLNLPSIRSHEPADEGPPVEIDLADGSAGGVTVGIGVSPHTPQPQEACSDSPSSPALIPASYRTVLAQAFGEVGRRAPSDDTQREEEAHRV